MLSKKQNNSFYLLANIYSSQIASAIDSVNQIFYEYDSYYMIATFLLMRFAFSGLIVTRGTVSTCEPFLSLVSTLTRDIDIAILSVRLSVCLSVRLSVTFRYWMKMA